MTSPTEITTTLRAVAELESPARARMAAKSIELVIRLMGRGYQARLASAIEVDRHTINNWVKGSTFISAAMALRVAETVASDLDDKSEMHRDDITNALFTRFYAENQTEAARWILDSFSTHFRWDALSNAA
jgi:DNA-binding XRE family transcriptional regulator